MPRNALTAFITVASLLSELIRDAPFQAASLTAKALVGRLYHGISLELFFLQRMYQQPVRNWTDYMSYLPDLEPGLRTLNWNGEGKRLTVDKLSSSVRLAECGVAVAPTLACVGRRETGPEGEDVLLLESPEAVARFLDCRSDNLFIKPASGWRGEGIFKLEHLNGGWGLDGKVLSKAEAAALLVDRAPDSGLLIQPELRSHPAMFPVGGDFGLSTVRINTALTRDGPIIVFVFVKLLGRPSLTDNFTEGRSGNMIARIDLASGRLTGVFGRPPGRRHLLHEIDRHPATGEALIGFQMPLWNETVELALRAAAAVPEAPLIGLDVAITPDGPMVIELQSDWGVNGGQLVLGGLRPVLRDVVPRLAINAAIRQRAFDQMGLGRNAPARERSTAPDCR